jgi:hypothetical protein
VPVAEPPPAGSETLDGLSGLAKRIKVKQHDHEIASRRPSCVFSLHALTRVVALPS